MLIKLNYCRDAFLQWFNWSDMHRYVCVHNNIIVYNFFLLINVGRVTGIFSEYISVLCILVLYVSPIVVCLVYLGSVLHISYLSATLLYIYILIDYISTLICISIYGCVVHSPCITFSCLFVELREYVLSANHTFSSGISLLLNSIGQCQNPLLLAS